MKLVNIKLIAIIFLITIIIATPVFAITDMDNGVMKVYNTNETSGFEYDSLRAFDIKGYIQDSNSTDNTTLISSTFGNYGYHTFLNVNGNGGEMSGELSDTDLEEKIQRMQYVAYDPSNEWQIIDGIKMKVNTKFINNGEQLQIIYTLNNTTSTAATISLATTADVQIDEDDSATIDRLEDGSGVRLWTKEGETGKPVQFVFYGKDVNGTTNIDNLWIGRWGYDYFVNMFNTNPDINKIENHDSAFAYSWVNRTINPGETKTYSVLMEVGEINVPNTGITLDNNTKFYYTDVKINGTIIDKDLKDKITIHYVVDGTEYTLPEISTTGTTKNFTLDLTTLNLSAGTSHSLKVWATDSTGCQSNIEERSFTVTYLKNPTVTVSNKEWTKENVTFRITDPVNVQQYVDKYQYRINGGSWKDCNKDTDIMIEENGNVQIDVRIIGSKANDFSDIITEYAKIDRVNPTDTIPTATKTTSSITVNLAQTDIHSGIDINKTMYSIKTGDSWSQWQASNIFNGLKDDTEYVVKTKATDMVGNVSESKELSVKTEKLLLGKLILKLINSEGENYTEDTWANKNIYVSVQEQSIGATTTYYSKENSAQSISKTNQETTVTKEGKTILLLSTTDGTNTVTSDIEHILKIDKIAPIINELALDNEEWTTTAKNITGKAIDILSGISAYQFSKQEDITNSSSEWNNITNTNEEIIQTIEVNESGKYYFYVKDLAGNIAKVNIDTKIDNMGPVITFTRANGETTINVTDTGAGVKNIQYAWSTENVKPIGEEWENYTKPVTYEGTSAETLYLWAKAIDDLDNTTTESTVFSVIKNPIIETKEEFINEFATFKLNSENQDSDINYQFKIDDGEWESISKDSLYTITNVKEGIINIESRILDNAGRYSDVIKKTIKVSVVEKEEEDDTNTNNVNNTITNGNTSQNSSTNNSTTNKNNSTNNTTNKKNNNTTTAPTYLPKAGSNYLMITIITILVIATIFAYRKIVLYKDIR